MEPALGVSGRSMRASRRQLIMPDNGTLPIDTMLSVNIVFLKYKVVYA